MNANPRKIELLAPAGNPASGIAAINCGADAVYIGASRFGAREKAGNSVKDIEGLCKYAHKYWARVYVTLNTLLTDAELPEALRLINELHTAGIDGLIIQDTGLLEMDLPDLPIIASTQMHNNTLEKVAFLEKIGFQRVILARELSLDQMADIRRHTSIDLECFVHGALCVGYSGQCYLSYAMGGRSGNRGACAQPCRRRYSLMDANGKMIKANAHLLSLKDLNLSEHLNALIQAGISSFKIEGRLKDALTISNGVGYYRRKLDEIFTDANLERTSSGKIRMYFIPDVSRTFNRGFSDFFIKGRHRKMAALKTPKSMGVFMGTVHRVTRQYFILKSARDKFCTGDGICFFDAADHLTGTTLHRVEEERIFPDKMDKIVIGTRIFRNHDHRFLKKMKQCPAERKIEMRLALFDTDTGFLLQAQDEDGNGAQYHFATEKMPAENKNTAMTVIEKQLKKMGGSDFFCSRVKIKTKNAYFIPVRDLNAMRRKVMGRLVIVRSENRPIKTGKIQKNDVPYPEKRLSYRGNVLNQKAADFYRRHGVGEIDAAAESGLDMQGKAVMFSKYCILFQLGYCRKNLKSPQIPEPLTLVDEKGCRFLLKTNCKGCEMEIQME